MENSQRKSNVPDKKAIVFVMIEGKYVQFILTNVEFVRAVTSSLERNYFMEHLFRLRSLSLRFCFS